MVQSNKRIVFIGIISLVVIIYFVKILSLQINNSYLSRAKNNALSKITIYPARSVIYDRNGKLLVENSLLYDLIVFPKQIKNLDTALFCNYLNINIAEFRKRMKEAVSNSQRRKKNNSFNGSAIFLANLNLNQYSVIQENLFRFKGFAIEPKTDRLYRIHGAAHVLGYLAEVSDKSIEQNKYYQRGDLVGNTGLEKFYENLIRGEKGLHTVWQDSRYAERGAVKDEEFNYPAKAGPDFYSTIDYSLQEFGEKLLSNKRGSVVAIEPATGEILAMINKPDYDPNDLVGESRDSTFRRMLIDPRKPLYNRAIKGMYPPGSTFKPVMALIGLQEGTLTPETSYGCYGGYFLGNLKVGCHAHPAPLALVPGLAISCNAYYCNVFRALLDNQKFGDVRNGYANLEKHLRAFGLGSALGIDLPGEAKGNVPSIQSLDKRHGKAWKSGTLISLGIGQGEILLTPLQMANVACILANKGWYIKPHFLKKIINSKQTININLEKHQTGIDTAHFRVVIDGMERVTKPGGTAWGTGIDGFVICSKTGTAQNPHGQDHSLYIAFSPRENPKIAVAVIVENGGFGATWAAPIANLLIEKYLSPADYKTKAPNLMARMLGGVTY